MGTTLQLVIQPIYRIIHTDQDVILNGEEKSE